MSKKYVKCEFCGRMFRPDRYNASHQTCCSRSECVRERDLQRKRRWQKKKRHEDEAFRLRENRRCAEANRCRRRRERQRELDIAFGVIDGKVHRSWVPVRGFGMVVEAKDGTFL